MSSFSNAFETDLLQWILEGAADPLSGVTEFEVHLHVGDPGESGSSLSSPATYTSYAPVTIDRNSATFTNGTNDVDFVFPQATGGTNTITHASLTRQGDTEIIVKGPLSVSLSVSNTIRPQIDAGNWNLTLD